MASGEQLEHLDERLRELGEGMAAIRTTLQILESTTAMMNKALFQGNGKPSLMTRVEMLEQAQMGFAAQCKDCKAIILANSKADGKTLIVVERWKAITAIVTAALASPVIIAVLATLLK